MTTAPSNFEEFLGDESDLRHARPLDVTPWQVVSAFFESFRRSPEKYDSGVLPKGEDIVDGF
jgi:hypothetical protein